MGQVMRKGGETWQRSAWGQEQRETMQITVGHHAQQVTRQA